MIRLTSLRRLRARAMGDVWRRGNLSDGVDMSPPQVDFNNLGSTLCHCHALAMESELAGPDQASLVDLGRRLDDLWEQYLAVLDEYDSAKQDISRHMSSVNSICAGCLSIWHLY